MRSPLEQQFHNILSSSVCSIPWCHSVTVHACVILFHCYKLLESPCLSLSSVGAALYPHDSCSFSFSRILKKENTVESKAKLIMDKCTAWEGSPSVLELISEELGAS
jgi:hypothetical protein